MQAMESIGHSRALVPVAWTPPVRPAGRAQAAFLVHLIATRRDLPQTRARRRADPAEATRAYRARFTRPPARPVLSRSL
jgi:hypothetical protein